MILCGFYGLQSKTDSIDQQGNLKYLKILTWQNEVCWCPNKYKWKKKKNNSQKKLTQAYFFKNRLTFWWVWEQRQDKSLILYKKSFINWSVISKLREINLCLALAMCQKLHWVICLLYGIFLFEFIFLVNICR